MNRPGSRLVLSPRRGHAQGACDCGHDHAPLPRLDAGEAGAGSSLWAALGPVLACAVCPACLSVYAKVFATIGVGAALSERQHLVVLLVAVAASVAVSAHRTWRTGRAWPVVIALVGCTLLLLGHLVAEGSGVEWLGMATLVIGGILEQRAVRRRRATSTVGVVRLRG